MFKSKGRPARAMLKESSRFFKKSAQKLWLNWDCDAETSTAQINKVLRLLVHKKKPSSSLRLRRPELFAT
jgi:hypothetical protein